MSQDCADEGISDDEFVYRRVSMESGWYDPSLELRVAWLAFRPNENDVGGISVWRAKYKSPREVARIAPRPGHHYYVLVLNAGRLREAGVELHPSPEDGGPGHASLINLSAEHYRSNKDAVRALAETIRTSLIEQVKGPFGPFDTDLG